MITAAQISTRTTWTDAEGHECRVELIRGGHAKIVIRLAPRRLVRRIISLEEVAARCNAHAARAAATFVCRIGAMQKPPT